jgi:hypothetical protein
LQAAKIIEPAIQRSVVMSFSKSKGPSRAMTVTASTLVKIVNEMAKQGVWHS